VNVVLFIAASGLVLVAAGGATMLLQLETTVDRAVTFGVIAVAMVEAVVLITGLAGHLRRGPVTVVAGAAAAVALVAFRRAGIAFPRWRRPPRLGAAVRRHPWEAALVALAAIALAWQAVVALVLPPFAYDAISYHLTIVGSWYAHGDVSVPALSACCGHYPANAETVFTWPVVLLGNDALVDTVQIAFALLGAVAVAGIARSAGVRRAGAVAAGALFVVTPIVLTQAPTAFVDVAIGAMVLAAVHLVVRFAVTGRWPFLIPAGLATGFVLGTKGIGALWGGALITLIVAILVGRVWRRLMTRRAAVAGAAGFVALCAAMGAFWYVRNWVDTGNPVYPFRVEVAGRTIFDGPESPKDAVWDTPDHARVAWPVALARSWSHDLHFWDHPPYDYQENNGGLGPVWVWLGLPLLVPVGIWLVRRRNAATLFLAVTALVLVLQPFRWWSRFTLALPAAGAVAIVLAVSVAPRRWMAGVVRVTTVGLAAAGVVLASYKVNPASQAPSLPATRLLRLATGPSSDRTLGRLFFAEYRFLDDVPRRATVVVDVDAAPIRFFAPFFGRSFTRRVVVADGRPPADGSWVVTAADRPLDRRLRADPRAVLVSDVRGVRAWHVGG